MEQKFDDFSMQEAMRLAKSETGKELIALFRQQNADALQSILNSTASGDMEQARRSITAFMASPEAKRLLEQLEAQNGRNGR